MSLEEVIRERDYALAEVAAKGLGEVGFLLVLAAALASTASAINATLYGTAGISYIIAKYGQLPRELGEKVWRNAPEGLIVIALLALVTVNSTDLETISFTGSGGFLLVFGLVNLAAYRLRKNARVNPLLALLGAFSAFTALAIMSYRVARQAPFQVGLFATVVAASFLIEYLYRAYARRKISPYIDEALRLREEAIANWKRWVPKVAHYLVKGLEALEVYLVGSVARDELHKAHDVDLLIITRRRLGREELKKLFQALKEKRLVEEHYPLDVHVAEPEDKERWLRHSRKYKPLYCK